MRRGVMVQKVIFLEQEVLWSIRISERRGHHWKETIPGKCASHNKLVISMIYNAIRKQFEEE